MLNPRAREEEAIAPAQGSRAKEWKAVMDYRIYLRYIVKTYPERVVG